jgi:phage terminase small subunit
MTKLTQKQEAFCLTYLECGTATDAYKRAYDASGSSQRTIEKRASELMQNGEVTGRIAALRAEAAAKAVLNEAWVIDRLMRNAEVALGDRKVAITYRPKAQDGKEGTPITVEVTERDAHAANRALELLGKKLGIFAPEKHEVTGKDGEPLHGPVDKVDIARRVMWLIRQAKQEAERRAAALPPVKH